MNHLDLKTIYNFHMIILFFELFFWSLVIVVYIFIKLFSRSWHWWYAFEPRQYGRAIHTMSSDQITSAPSCLLDKLPLWASFVSKSVKGG